MQGAAQSFAVEELVERARSGRREAFDELVLRFQGMALGTAWSWLRDVQAAQDVAQDAFIEAYLNLGRLRDPAAFPGFLRTIVRKHCDRRTRGVQRVAVPLEAAENGVPGLGADAARPATEGADETLVRSEEHRRLRGAVEVLPPHERLVVALHYLAGLPQREVADWLELPLSTIKKRLHSARGRLRGVIDDGEAEEGATMGLDLLQPAAAPPLPERIRFFLAIRAGDEDEVRALLDDSPELVEAEERWDLDLTRELALPVPTGATPLIRAAERDDVAMVELLFERGARLDTSCSCAGGESALWAAVANGRTRVARRLLELGADPDPVAFAGHTPLHVAALRGCSEIADALLARGADPQRRDAHGRTPRDWAETKGHSDLAARLGATPEASSAAEGTARERSDSQGVEAPVVLETGLKAIDLFAPLTPGARVQMRFDPGQGAVVLLAEMSHRVARSSGGRAVVWAGWDRHAVDRGEVEQAFAEFDLWSRARLVWGSAAPGSGGESARGTADRALDEALRLQGAGARHVLVVLFARPGRAAEIESVLPRAGVSEAGSISIVVAERDGDPSSDEAPLARPWDARLAFDPALAAIRSYPALHPTRTVSAALREDVVGAAHCRVAGEARALLMKMRAWAPDLREPRTDLGEDDQRLLARARKLQAYFTQPFHVAESFSGIVGVDAPRAGVVEDVDRILSGALDDVDAVHCLMKARVDDITASARAAAPPR